MIDLDITCMFLTSDDIKILLLFNQKKVEFQFSTPVDAAVGLNGHALLSTN